MTDLFGDIWTKINEGKRAEYEETHEGQKRGDRFYPSDMGGCTRRQALRYAGAPTTEPDTGSHHTMGVGTAIHEHLEKNVEHLIPEGVNAYETEQEINFERGNVRMHGYVDLVMDWDDSTREIVDWKSEGSYPFLKLAKGQSRTKYSQIMQGMIYATALDADRVRIVHLAKDKPTKRDQAQISGSLTTVETVVDVADWENELKQELARLNRIAAPIDKARDKAVDEWKSEAGIVKAANMPAQVYGDDEMPENARIVDPEAGKWQLRAESDGGHNGAVLVTEFTWRCGYCPFQSVCVEHNPTTPGQDF